MIACYFIIAGSAFCLGEEKHSRKQEAYLGLDLTGVYSCSLSVCASYRLSSNWSVSFNTDISLEHLRKRPKKIDSEHQEILDEIYDMEDRSYIPENEINIEYWHRTTFEGPFLMLGFRLSEGSMPDLSIGMGYMFRIWKGLNGMMSFNPGLGESLKNGKFPYNRIKAGITYVF